MQIKKTSGLFIYCCVVPAIISGKNEKIKNLKRIGSDVGLLFQIVDDLIDYKGNYKIAGKKTNKDKKRGKATLINILGYYGIKSTQVSGLTGVWVESGVSSKGQLTSCKANDLPSKIGSIGIRVDKNGISQHGFALNIDIQDSYFEGIVPCGLEGYGTISMSEVLSDVPTIQDVQSTVIREFGRIFDKEMVLSDRLSVDPCIYSN